MTSILNDEGFDVSERQLSKIRQKNGLWIRENRRSHAGAGNEGEEDKEEETAAEAATGEKRAREGHDANVPQEIVAKRRERHARLMEESEDKLKSRTRRRRTKGWAGLPPDEGMGPRFPSELTLAEAIVDLGLDKDEYRKVRQEFEGICQANNVIKKTICGPEKWLEVKQILIGRFPKLQAIFWVPHQLDPGQTRQPMALDVVCMDVTKRLRTAGNYMTIADAKNTLGLTPQESRDARNAFDAILRADFFTGKLEATKEHWEELKGQWIQASTRLRMALALGEADPAYGSKVRAVEAIARDVQKRNRDRQTRHVFPRLPDTSEESRVIPVAKSSGTAARKPGRTAKKGVAQATSQGQKYEKARKAGTELLQQVNTSLNFDDGSTSTNPIATLASQALATAPSQTNGKDYSGMQIDPSLLEAAALPQDPADSMNDLFAQIQNAALPETLQKSVYFRLSLSSVQQFPSAPKIWLDTMPIGSTDLGALRALAVRGSGLDGIASVQRVEGVAAGDGGEKWAIDEDDELEAYLAMVGNGKATFVIDLAQGPS